MNEVSGWVKAGQHRFPKYGKQNRYIRVAAEIVV